MTRICLKLYYKENSRSYGNKVGSIIKKILALNRDLGVATRIYESKSLSSLSISKVIDEIRVIISQKRGSIVTSRDSLLPLSHSKQLNLENTPVLLVEEGRRPIYVFPCRLGESYYDLEGGIAMIRANWPTLKPLVGQTEGIITKEIREHPELLEDRLRLEKMSTALDEGEVDVVYRDSEDRILIVEVEREATDAALGQILRLGAGFERNKEANPEGRKVRLGIVCLRASKFIGPAAKRAGIEIWKAKSTDPLNFDKIIDVEPNRIEFV